MCCKQICARAACEVKNLRYYYVIRMRKVLTTGRQIGSAEAETLVILKMMACWANSDTVFIPNNWCLGSQLAGDPSRSLRFLTLLSHKHSTSYRPFWSESLALLFGPTFKYLQMKSLKRRILMNSPTDNSAWLTPSRLLTQWSDFC